MQISAAGRLLGVEYALVAVYSMPRQCCQGRRKFTGSSLGVFVIIRISQYLGLSRSFGRKIDGNRPTRGYGVG